MTNGCCCDNKTRTEMTVGTVQNYFALLQNTAGRNIQPGLPKLVGMHATLFVAVETFD